MTIIMTNVQIHRLFANVEKFNTHSCLPVYRYELNKVQVLQGKMIVVETRLVEQEKQLKRQKQASAVTRLRKEHKAVQRATRALATEKRLATALLGYYYNSTLSLTLILTIGLAI